MKLFIKICFLLLLPVFAKAQSPQTELDSLHQSVQLAKNDTTRMYAFWNLGSYYDDVNLDSAVYYCEKAITIARQLLWVHLSFAGLLSYTGNYEKAIVEANEAKRIAESFKDTSWRSDIYTYIGNAYLKLNKPDSALYFNQMALTYGAAYNKKWQGYIYIQIGETYLQMGDTTHAKENFKKAIQVSTLYNNPVKKGDAHLELARLFQSQNKFDSGLYHSKEALAILKLAGKEKSTAIAYKMISDCYWSLGTPDCSFVYLRLARVLNDKLDKAEKEKIQEFQVAGFEEEAVRSQELEKEKIQTQKQF